MDDAAIFSFASSLTGCPISVTIAARDVFDMDVLRTKTRIAVALSGGVDSSVAAALLLKQGYEVRGVFMKNFENLTDPAIECPWKEDQAAAEAAARHLGIPFTTWNFEREYAASVLAYFLQEYAVGRTPNPDVRCNRDIKFGAFLDRARAEGFEAVATGHYVRVRENGQGRRFLLRGCDRSKDQSYFLTEITQPQLRSAVFPVGSMAKTEVRAFAKRLAFPNADRPDSQGICFLGRVDLPAFLRERLTVRPGPIATTGGEVLGLHEGLPLYTIGQRRGLRIGGAGVPYYVAGKDPLTNTLLVAKGSRAPELYRRSLIARNVSWISGQPKLPKRLLVQIRYRQYPQPAFVEAIEDTLRVTFEAPQRAVTPGQFVALYEDEVCFGGGAIDEVLI